MRKNIENNINHKSHKQMAKRYINLKVEKFRYFLFSTSPHSKEKLRLLQSKV